MEESYVCPPRLCSGRNITFNFNNKTVWPREEFGLLGSDFIVR